VTVLERLQRVLATTTVAGRNEFWGHSGLPSFRIENVFELHGHKSANDNACHQALFPAYINAFASKATADASLKRRFWRVCCHLLESTVHILQLWVFRLPKRSPPFWEGFRVQHGKQCFPRDVFIARVRLSHDILASSRHFWIGA